MIRVPLARLATKVYVDRPQILFDLGYLLIRVSIKVVGSLPPFRTRMGSPYITPLIVIGSSTRMHSGLQELR